jgi:hypothetical protein
MKRYLPFFLGVGLFAQNPVIDLDAPVVKKVIIKTEIERGKSAEFDCTLRLSHADPIGSSKCPFNIIDLNKQKNTDTDPFILGVAYEAWTHTRIILSVIENLPDREQRGYSQGIGDAILWFKTFKEKEKSLGIDDETFCKATGLKYDKLEQDVELWERKVAESNIHPPRVYRAGIKFTPGSDSLHVLMVDPPGPNKSILGKYIKSIDGERGTGVSLQSALSVAIAKHQDGSPIKVTITNAPTGNEDELDLILF